MSDEFFNRIMGRMEEGDYEADDSNLMVDEEEVQEEAPREAPREAAQEAAQPQYVTRDDFEEGLSRYSNQIAEQMRQTQKMFEFMNQRFNQAVPSPEPEQPPSLEEKPIDALAYGLEQNQRKIDELIDRMNARQTEETFKNYLSHVNGTVADQVNMVIEEGSEYPLPDYKEAASHLVKHLIWEIKSHNPGMTDGEVAVELDKWWLNYAAGLIKNQQVVPFAVYDWAMRVGYRPKSAREAHDEEREVVLEQEIQRRKVDRAPAAASSQFRPEVYDVDDLDSLGMLSHHDGSYARWASQFPDARTRFEQIRAMQQAAYSGV